MKRGFALLGICALSVAALAPAPQAPDKLGPLKELAGARVKVCERMLDFYRESFKAPPPAAAAPQSPADRYDYLYSPEELAPWIDNIKNVARHTRETYVITNNHFRGKGIVNALEIKSALEGAKVPGPASLATEYPRIKEAVILS